MTRPYRKVWTGGTFDHLHDGHKELFEKAFEVGDLVIIGLTADDIVRTKAHADLIQPVEVRKAALERYLGETYGEERFRVVVQESVYTEASLDPDLQANILCYKTEQHHLDINQRRRELGIPELEAVMSADRMRGVVSSTLIRERLSRGR